MARHFKDDSEQRAYARQARRGDEYRQQQPHAAYQRQEQAYTPAPYGSGQAAPAPRRRKKKSPLPVVLAVVVVALAGVGVYLFLNPPFFKVSVNGAEQSVSAGTTVQSCIDEGLAAPSAGNLIAVDGSVAQEGGGSAFTATVNGQAAEGSTVLKSGDQVQIDNGADVEEGYTETTEAVAHGTSGVDYSTLSSYYNGSIHVMSAGEDGETNGGPYRNT